MIGFNFLIYEKPSCEKLRGASLGRCYTCGPPPPTDRCPPTLYKVSRLEVDEIIKGESGLSAVVLDNEELITLANLDIICRHL